MKNYTSFLNRDNLPEGYHKVIVGDLELPSGILIAGDPFSMPIAALDKKVAPGDYEVTVIYKNCNEWGYRIAYAIIKISEGVVEEWTKATNKFGFDVIVIGSGLAAFADKETVVRFNQLLEEYRMESKGNYYDDILSKEVLHEIFPGERKNCFGIHEPKEKVGSIAIFESGYGDGDYGMYWGVLENREPAIFLIDFDVEEVI